MYMKLQYERQTTKKNKDNDKDKMMLTDVQQLTST